MAVDGRSRLARGAPVRLAGHALSVLLSFTAAALLLRHLGKAGSGVLFAGLSLLALAQAVSDLGLGASGVRDYSAASPEDRPQLLRRLLALRVALLVAGLTVLLMISAGIGHQSPGGLSLGAVWVLLLVWVSTATIPFTQRLQIGFVTTLQLLQSAGTLVTTFLLTVADVGPAWFFGVGIPGALVSLAAIRQAGGAGALPVPGGRPATWPLHRAALTLGVATVFGVAFYRMGPLAVSALDSSEAAGVYGAAFRIFDVGETVAPLLLAVVLPLLARDARSDTERMTRNSVELIKAMVLLGGAAGLLLFMAAPLAVSLLGGPEFRDATEPLQILALAMPVAFAGQTCGYTLLAMHRHAAMLAGVSAALVTAVAVLALTVPAHGAHGGALALLMSQCVLTISYLLGLRGVGAGRLAAHSALGIALSWAATAAYAGVHARGALPAVLAALLAFGVGAAVTRLLPLQLLRSAVSGGRTAGS